MSYLSLLSDAPAMAVAGVSYWIREDSTPQELVETATTLGLELKNLAMFALDKDTATGAVDAGNLHGLIKGRAWCGLPTAKLAGLMDRRAVDGNALIVVVVNTVSEIIRDAHLVVRPLSFADPSSKSVSLRETIAGVALFSEGAPAVRMSLHTWELQPPQSSAGSLIMSGMSTQVFMFNLGDVGCGAVGRSDSENEVVHNEL